MGTVPADRCSAMVSRHKHRFQGRFRSAVDNSVCSPSYGVIEVCNANYGNNGLLGYTQLYTGGGHIVMATVVFNDYYMLDNPYYARDVWYSYLACHGLGHALGLNHIDESKANPNSGSCLDVTPDPAGKRTGSGPLTDLAPGALDFAALADIYAVPSGPQLPSTINSSVSVVPEMAVWSMLLVGFGLVGACIRGTKPEKSRKSLHLTYVTKT